MLCGIRTNSLNRISNHVRYSIKNKSPPTIGSYIVESLVNKNIEVGFGYNKMGPYSPIYKYAQEHEDFNIVFEKYEKNSGYRALKYSMNTNNMGVVISTSTIGFGNIMSPIGAAQLKKQPLLLLSFFDPDNELKISPFPDRTKHYIKESITIKTTKHFSIDMEQLISYGYEFPAGPVHLNVSNKILDLPIVFGVKKDWSNESSSTELVKSSPIRKYILQPEVSFSRQSCNMLMENTAKRKQTLYPELIDIH